MLSTSTHVYSEIHLHLNWHTKNNAPFLRGEKEIRTHAFLRDYCEKSKGIRFLGLGGTEDHVHLLIQMEPFVTLSDWVGKIKGTCSHAINEEFGEAPGVPPGRPSVGPPAGLRFNGSAVLAR